MPKRINLNVPTWMELNAMLRNIHKESVALKLVEELRQGGANARWLKRATARYRKLRFERENKEFETSLKRKFIGVAGEGELGRAAGFDWAEEVEVTSQTTGKRNDYSVALRRTRS